MIFNPANVSADRITPRFPSSINPVHKGPYRVFATSDIAGCGYAYWNGDEWETLKSDTATWGSYHNKIREFFWAGVTKAGATE